MSTAGQSPSHDMMAFVLFMDIVSYSLRFNEDQTEVLTILQNIVRESAEYQRASTKEEVLSLPAGDGMALVFLRDPVSPARCALEVAASLQSHPEIKLRMGLHTGPVRRHADIKEEMNVVGGGINTAQRVMDCGDAGHILLSRNVAEILEQLRGWNESLQDLGIHEVKHGVKVHLYNLCKDGLGNPELPRKVSKSHTSALSRWKWPLVAGFAILLAIAGYVFWPARSLQVQPIFPKPPLEDRAPVAVADGMPFWIVLTEDIPADAEPGKSLQFTVADGLRVGDALVMAKGATVTGVISEAAKKRWFPGMGGKLTFRLLRVLAMDGQKLLVRATPGRRPGGQAQRPVEVSGGIRSKGVAAVAGARYIAYIDGGQVVSPGK